MWPQRSPLSCLSNLAARRAWRATPLLIITLASSLLGASTSQAQDWGATATISSTMGVNDGRLCLGEASRGDIGCPTYSPYITSAGYVGLGTTAPSSTLHVMGTINGTALDLGNSTNASIAIRRASGAVATALGSADGNTSYISRYGGQLGIGTATPSTTLHVSGTLRIADGAESCDTDRLGALKYASGAFYICQNTSNGWEPLATSGATANTDRITSNSQAGITANSTGYISLTTGGVTGTAYFTPASVLVNAGISTTGPVSGSNGYFTGSLGIGTTTPSSMVEISATTAGLTITHANTASDFGAVLFKSSGLNRWMLGALPSSSSLASNAFVIMQAADASDAVLNRIALAVANNGYVGINTSVPSTTLDVQGTLRVTYSGEACDANRLGGIGYTSNDIYVCRNGTSWESLTSISGGATTDRITSGTTGVYTYSNTSASIATAGVERVVIGTDGNVGIGQQPVSGIALSVSGSTKIYSAATTGTAFTLQNGDSNGRGYAFTSTASANAMGPGNLIVTDLTAGLHRFALVSSGYVGIGTVDPSTTLHVSGTARASTLQLPDQTIGTCDNTSHNTMKFVNGRPYYCRP